MLKVAPEIKVFLEDDSSYLLKLHDEIYQKVPYSDSLIILNYSNDFNLKSSSLAFLGIYSKIRKEFLVVTNSENLKISYILNNPDKKDVPYLSSLESDLNVRVKNEIITVLNLMIKPTDQFSEVLLEEAKEYILSKREPVFAFESETNSITLENLEDFTNDRDDFAYNIAENKINEDYECKVSYKKYVDLLAAINYIKNNTPIDFELENIIRDIADDCKYRNYKVIATKNGNDEYILTEQSERDLNAFPVYAIKKIIWGRTILFDVENYDKNQIKALRTDIEYNIKYIKQINSYSQIGFLVYLDESLYSNFDFCKEYVKIGYSYEKVNLKLKENISFIKEIQKYVNTACLIKETPENVIIANKDYFSTLLFKNVGAVRSIYTSLPKDLQLDDNILLKAIALNGIDIIDSLDVSVFNNPKVQTAFDEWFLSNPVYPFLNFYKKCSIPVNMLQNRRTRILALCINGMNMLDDSDLNDESFIMEYLERLKDCNAINKNYFSGFYNSLKDLKTDMNVLEKMLEIFTIDYLDWSTLDTLIKQNLDFQKKVVLLNKELLYCMDDSTKEYFLIKDAYKYLPYTTKKSKNLYSKHYDFDLLFDLLKKGCDSKILEYLSYDQKNDLKIAKKLTDLSIDNYKYLGRTLQNDLDIARKVVKYKSIIPMLPEKSKHWESLWDNEEIIRASLEHSPLDFADIPQASRQTGPAPLLENKDFIMFACELDPGNSMFLSSKSPFIEDKDVAYVTLKQDLSYCNSFAGKLYRDENFVYKICEYWKNQIDTNLQNKELWLEDIHEKLMPMIPKKIKETKDFKTMFPEF